MRKAVLALIMLLLLLAVLPAGAQDGEKVLVTGLGMTSGDLDNGADPSLSTAVAALQVVESLYVGLTRLNEETVEVEPGMATSWQVSEDGTVYTFTLLEDVPWVRYNMETGAVEEVTDENGSVRTVTAQDFVYGITRTLDPETAADYAYVLAPYIVGGEDFNAGEGSAEDLGVRAVDTYTLEITAPEAVAFAINIYGLPMAVAQPQWAIEEWGDSWVEPENRHSYGPFAMSEWNHDQDLTMVRNPFWPGTDSVPQPALDAVVFRFLDDSAQFAEYQAGTMDAILAPISDIDRIRADPTLSAEYYAGPEGCSNFYGFNTTKAPFDNVNIRRAFSLAIDRESLMNNVTRDGRLPARWYTYPGVTAGPTLDTHPDLGVSYDPEGANAALAAGLEELGLGGAGELPPISLVFGDNEYNTLVAQAVQQMWAETLGVQVDLVAIDTSTYFDTVAEDPPQIFRGVWCYDYPDANNFLFETMRSDSLYNDTKWANAEFDTLVDEARTMTDAAARLERYARAEEILVDEVAAIAPLYWNVSRELVRPYVERTYSRINSQRYEKWDINR